MGAHPDTTDTTVTSRSAVIDGLKIHYLSAGHGSKPVVLLHGYAETSRRTRPALGTRRFRQTVWI